MSQNPYVMDQIAKGFNFNPGGAFVQGQQDRMGMIAAQYQQQLAQMQMAQAQAQMEQQAAQREAGRIAAESMGLAPQFGALGPKGAQDARDAMFPQLFGTTEGVDMEVGEDGQRIVTNWTRQGQGEKQPTDIKSIGSQTKDPKIYQVAQGDNLVTYEYDPVTKRRVELGRGPRLGRTESDPKLSGTRQDVIREQYDDLGFRRDQIGEMITLIASDPSYAGVVGAGRRVGQTVFGVGEDLVSFFGANGATGAANIISSAQSAAMKEAAAGGIDESTLNRLFRDDKISEMQLYENSLGFTLARLRQPDGRLLASVINQAIKDAKITGISSSQDALARQRQIYREIDYRINSMGDRLGIESSPGQGGPAVGTTEDGYQFTGGNPADPNNWQKVQ